jgi:hypothetical protein
MVCKHNLVKTCTRHILNVFIVVYCFRNVVAHDDAQKGKWGGNWWMEWVASTLTRPRNVVYPALLMLMRTPRLPADDWTDSPTDLNGLVHLGERRNLVSAHVPSGSTRALTHLYLVRDMVVLGENNGLPSKGSGCNAQANLLTDWSCLFYQK